MARRRLAVSTASAVVIGDSGGVVAGGVCGKYLSTAILSLVYHGRLITANLSGELLLIIKVERIRADVCRGHAEVALHPARDHELIGLARCGSPEPNG